MTHKDTVALYWPWVESESAAIRADGCTGVLGAYRRACLQHDLSYYYARDPVSAYRRYVAGDWDPWDLSSPMTRAQADAALRRCIQSQSPLGFFSLYALERWVGTRLLARKAWNTHRARDRWAA